MKTKTIADHRKDTIIEKLRELINEKRGDIESGIEDGTYEDDEDNQDTLKDLSDMDLLVDNFEKYRPNIYILVEGGNIQGISATEEIGIDIYDKDNLHADEDRYIEENGSIEEWDANLKTMESNNEVKGIY